MIFYLHSSPADLKPPPQFPHPTCWILSFQPSLDNYAQLKSVIPITQPPCSPDPRLIPSNNLEIALLNSVTREK